MTPAGGVPTPGPPDPDGLSHPRSSRRARTELGQWIRTFGIALVVMVVIRAFLVQSFVVPTGSMENTLVPGDRILVSRLDRGPSIERGDVVVFDGTDTWGAPSTASRQTGIAGILSSMASFVSLGSGADYVKRVVGVPGDRVKCCDTAGRLTVNGVVVDEPYLYPGNAASTTPFDVIVPAGRIWVMGDHRSNSADSRAHLGQPGGGMIPLDDVVGRAWLRYWPLDRIGSIAPAPSLSSIPTAAP
ncbi:MAG: signal peptidase I [Dermatophilaceae bacterium]